MTDHLDTDSLMEGATNRETTNPTIGTHNGYEVRVAAARSPPDAPYPDEFSVNLYVPRSDGENVDIARVDTAGDGCHIDRLYLPRGHRQRKHDYTFQTARPEGAIQYVLDNERWREWIERYETNHGLP